MRFRHYPSLQNTHTLLTFQELNTSIIHLSLVTLYLHCLGYITVAGLDIA